MTVLKFWSTDTYHCALLLCHTFGKLFNRSYSPLTSPLRLCTTTWARTPSESQHAEQLVRLSRGGLRCTGKFPWHGSHCHPLWIWSLRKDTKATHGAEATSSGHMQSACHAPAPPKLGGEFPASRAPLVGRLDSRGREKQRVVIINYFIHKIQKDLSPSPSILRPLWKLK